MVAGGGPTAATATRPESWLEARSAAAAPATSLCTRPWTASPAWPTPKPSRTKKACTAVGFVHCAKVFFPVHGITPYTPRHNGKVERYNRI